MKVLVARRTLLGRAKEKSLHNGCISNKRSATITGLVTFQLLMRCMPCISSYHTHRVSNTKLTKSSRCTLWTVACIC